MKPQEERRVVVGDNGAYLTGVTDQSSAILQRHLKSKCCVTCGAHQGDDCFRFDWNGAGFIRTQKRQGTVHMGRVPEDYDALQVLREAGWPVA